MVRVQEGRHYLARSGEVVGPMIRRSPEYPIHNVRYPWEDKEGFTWTAAGKFLDNATVDHELDLVSEIELRDILPQPACVWGVSPSKDDDRPSTNYALLRAVLDQAYAQAAHGKGKDRHANDRSFEDQPIMTIGRMLSSVCDGELYQAIKKAQEASGMIRRGEFQAAKAELLGGMNYLAAAFLLVAEEEEKSECTTAQQTKGDPSSR